MSTSQGKIEEMQREVCRKYKAAFIAASDDSIIGFAKSTKGLTPINGLRHPPAGESNGWYIWCGETFSDADDFFVPLHTRHLNEDYPQITALLGLPPGYRFLLAGDSLDVWYDSLLMVV
jgi:hypothetical protein